MSGFVYIRSEPGLWTVGTYGPDGKWHPESDHGNPGAAAERVAALNGTPGAVLTAAPATLPALDAECGTCQGNGVVTSPEWLTWNEREKTAEREWRAENPGGSWFSSEAFELMSELQPENAEAECPKCQGSGYTLTEAGRALLAFLQRHPPALTRVSTNEGGQQ